MAFSVFLYNLIHVNLTVKLYGNNHVLKISITAKNELFTVYV